MRFVEFWVEELVQAVKAERIGASFQRQFRRVGFPMSPKIIHEEEKGRLNKLSVHRPFSHVRKNTAILLNLVERCGVPSKHIDKGLARQVLARTDLRAQPPKVTICWILSFLPLPVLSRSHVLSYYLTRKVDKILCRREPFDCGLQLVVSTMKSGHCRPKKDKHKLHVCQKFHLVLTNDHLVIETARRHLFLGKSWLLFVNFYGLVVHSLALELRPQKNKTWSTQYFERESKRRPQEYM